MSADIPGLVQTSLNLGVVYTDETAVVGKFAIRSSVESQKRMLADRVTCLGELLGAEIDTAGDYPGWAYRQDSPLRDLMRETYLDLYGKEPRIEAIHAGLECGLFAGKIPGLDCVSFGPDLKDIHTPRETMFIGSVQRTWQLLLEIPWGQTATYGQLAEKAAAILCKKRMSAQAVGQAVGRNPVSILVPCHRVVGADGSLTGYAGGLDRKKWLLCHEGWKGAKR